MLMAESLDFATVGDRACRSWTKPRVGNDAIARKGRVKPKRRDGMPPPGEGHSCRGVGGLIRSARLCIPDILPRRGLTVSEAQPPIVSIALPRTYLEDVFCTTNFCFQE